MRRLGPPLGDKTLVILSSNSGFGEEENITMSSAREFAEPLSVQGVKAYVLSFQKSTLVCEDQDDDDTEG